MKEFKKGQKGAEAGEEHQVSSTSKRNLFEKSKRATEDATAKNHPWGIMEPKPNRRESGRSDTQHPHSPPCQLSWSTRPASSQNSKYLRPTNKDECA